VFAFQIRIGAMISEFADTIGLAEGVKGMPLFNFV
jgi:hypothetical protein